jgi:hypothetical protein
MALGLEKQTKSESCWALVLVSPPPLSLAHKPTLALMVPHGCFTFKA